ncbi:hypothetical protein [Petrimonas mucosa]|uniref:hypothetical protein n=1 Tax=Petrimonas mucosa TaxID=1642646 RepID=UPI001750F38B|nr:hypothetical protein [Petrimonas mucosa]HHT28979.1 hypothetical protein [Petrimonas mucosa]
MKTFIKTVLIAVLSIALTSCIIKIPASTESTAKTDNTGTSGEVKEEPARRPTTPVIRPDNDTIPRRPTTPVIRPDKSQTESNSTGRVDAPTGKNNQVITEEKSDEGTTRLSSRRKDKR